MRSTRPRAIPAARLAVACLHVVVLAACAVDPAEPPPIRAVEPTSAAVATAAVAAKAGSTAFPAATAALEPTALAPSVATPARPAPSPTLPATATALATPAGFPRDAQGRVIGGELPILNYSPRLITGQDCPRVTSWGQQTLRFDSGLAIGVLDTPCAVQNAVDDFAAAAGADPSFLSLDGLRTLAPKYGADPLLSRLYPEWWRQRFIANGAFMGFSRYVCDAPMYRLLNVDAQAPTFNRNAKVLQLHVALVSERLRPFACEMRRFVDDAPDPKARRIVRTAADLASPNAFPVFVVYAMYSEVVGRWQFTVAAPTQTFYSRAFVEALYAAGGVKPW